MLSRIKGVSDAKVLEMFDFLYGYKRGNYVTGPTPWDETILKFAQALVDEVRRAGGFKETVGITYEQKAALSLKIRNLQETAHNCGKHDSKAELVPWDDPIRKKYAEASRAAFDAVNALPSGAVDPRIASYESLKQMHANQRTTIERLQQAIQAIKASVNQASQIATFGPTTNTQPIDADRAGKIEF